MQGINTKENVHFWDNTQGKICVSLEETKTFMTFESLDNAVNWLYLNDYKESARQLNKTKESQNA